MHWALGWTIWADKLLAAWRGIEEAEMNKPAVIQLRLPRSVKNGVERWAKLDGTSMNQLIASAVAEKLSALETAEFFEERARRADVDTFDRIMNRAGGEPPRAGDEMPKGYKRRSHKAGN